MPTPKKEVSVGVSKSASPQEYDGMVVELIRSATTLVSASMGYQFLGDSFMSDMLESAVKFLNSEFSKRALKRK